MKHALALALPDDCCNVQIAFVAVPEMLFLGNLESK